MSDRPGRGPDGGRASSDEEPSASSLLEELKRRKVFRVAVVYAATAFVVLQAADLMLPRLGVPDWALSFLVGLVLLGFPIALVLAWAFEVTPDGVRRTEGLGLGEVEGATGGAAAGGRHAWLGRRTLAVVGGLVLLGVALGAGWFLGSDPASEEAGAGRAEASVAALPFANLSADEEDRYFADGVHEEILTRLARVDSLKVISRTSVMAYRDTDTNLRQIGEELGVRYILEGSVRRVDDRVRVSAQLIDAESDGHVWTETYDRSVSDVLAIQSEVASRIAEALKSEITPEERRRIESRPTESEEAYDLYLRAESFGWRGWSANRSEQERLWRRAVDALEEAVSIDPGFALAWAELGRWNIELYWFGYDRTDERRERADRASARAVELAPELGEAHLARAQYHYHGHREYGRALESARRARRFLPGDQEVPLLIGAIQRRMGRYGEAIDNFERAQALDPRNPQRAQEVGVTIAVWPDSAAVARGWLERAVQIEPTYALPYAALAELHVHAHGDVTAARSELARYDRAAGGSVDPYVVVSRFWLAAYDRDESAALEALDAVEGPMLNLQDDVLAVDLLRGLALRWGGHDREARQAFERAVSVMEAEDRAQPDYYGVLQNLALAHAAAGNAEQARTAIARARELLPVERDRWIGPWILVREAMVHVLLGDHDPALRALERLRGLRYGKLLSMAGSPHVLRLNPVWDPLRDDPRFQALLSEPPSEVVDTLRD